MAKTCIYCESDGPFNDEHVFSAGPGGDDKRFMLRNMVCQHCNSVTFSALEAKFMHEGPDALGRAFMQPETRRAVKAKGKSSTRFHPENARIYLDDTGERPVEIGINGKESLVPQFVLVGKSLRPSGSDLKLFQKFVNDVAALLALDVLPVVSKQRDSEGATYSIQYCTWNGSDYSLEKIEVQSMAPKKCVWLIEDKNGAENATRHPKIFQRAGGQIVFEPGDDVGVIDFLTRLRNAYPRVMETAKTATLGTKVQNFVVKLNLPVEFGIRERVLAKIGMNFAILIHGEAYIRQPCFDPVKKGILTGESPIACAVMSVDQVGITDEFRRLFDEVPNGRHFCMLALQPNPSQNLDLMFLVRLYGGAVTIIQLAHDVPVPSELIAYFWEIDYHANTIEQYSTFDYLHGIRNRNMAASPT